MTFFRSSPIATAMVGLILVGAGAGCARSQHAPAAQETPAAPAALTPPAATPAATPAPGAPPPSLVGTSWVLQDLTGSGVISGAQATLEFPEAGKAVGNGSCNRFFGSVEVKGEWIKFGAIGSTRMACADPVSLQETKYFKALQDAERYSIDGAVLSIYVKGTEKPLRFTKKAP